MGIIIPCNGYYNFKMEVVVLSSKQWNMFGLFKSKAKKSDLTYSVYLTKITLYRQLMATVHENELSKRNIYSLLFWPNR